MRACLGKGRDGTWSYGKPGSSKTCTDKTVCHYPRM